MSVGKTVTPKEVEYAIGRDYVEIPSFDGEDSPMVEEYYSRIARRHTRLYEQIPIPVIWTHDDPYGSVEEMFEHIDSKAEMLVFAGGSSPKYMKQDHNVMGRAVHDYFGHYYHQLDFSFKGEFLKWYQTKHMYPPETHRILFTEIVAQRAAAGFLEDGFESPQFRQRAFAAPERWIEMCKEVLL